MLQKSKKDSVTSFGSPSSFVTDLPLPSQALVTTPALVLIQVEFSGHKHVGICCICLSESGPFPLASRCIQVAPSDGTSFSSWLSSIPLCTHTSFIHSPLGRYLCWLHTLLWGVALWQRGTQISLGYKDFIFGLIPTSIWFLWGTSNCSPWCLF